MFIDAKLLHEALNYYHGIGFELISAPMLVHDRYNAWTCPNNIEGIKRHSDGLGYVGSAEQSFLSLLHSDQSKYSDGMYCMVTPCVRNEPVLDDLHYEVFLKVELISTRVDVRADDLAKFALKFFTTYNSSARIVLEDSPNSRNLCDILINGDIEVGSYGTDTFNGVTYHFGTGLALPRFEKE